MGIDIYARWKSQSEQEEEAQYAAALSGVHGHVGYGLRIGTTHFLNLFKPERDIPKRSQVRKEIVVLEHHTNSPADLPTRN